LRRFNPIKTASTSSAIMIFLVFMASIRKMAKRLDEIQTKIPRGIGEGAFLRRRPQECR
jgi:tetrahydromethanopterin S-methyltransferase subunit G